jgi:hypothetical protein
MFTAGTPQATGWRRWGSWVGAAGMLVALWFYFFVGLVAPWWMVPVMLALWLLLAVVAWQRASTAWVPLVMPLVAMGLWFGVLSAGGAWFGWSA